jgi:hypothetical protein
MGIDVFGRNTYGGGQWDVCERFSVFLVQPMIIKYFQQELYLQS